MLFSIICINDFLSMVQINLSKFYHEKFHKISLVLVSFKCAPWLAPRDRKGQHFACYKLLENAFSSVN